MIVWPWEALPPGGERWWISGSAIQGGQTVGGSMRLARTDGGGLWRGEQTFNLFCREQVLAARAIEAQLDGGVVPIVAWSFELPFAPPPPSVLVPHSDGAPFSDETRYLSSGFSLTATESADLRSVFLKVSGDWTGLRGGEHFMIEHSVMGPRRYRIASVIDGVIEFRTPLRQRVPAGTRLVFDRVGCVVRLMNPEEFMAGLDLNHFSSCTARWVEAFDAR